MGRTSVQIREAVPRDAEELLTLWVDYAERKAARLLPPTTSEAYRAIIRSADNPFESLQVAELDGRLVGVAHLRRSPLSPLHDEEAVHVSHLYVDPDTRRRGIGRALLAHAASWAEEQGSAHLLASVSAGSRDANRFLACLGLAQVATVRCVPVAVLRQRLNHTEPEADTPALQARRRTLLRRQISSRTGRGVSAHM